MSASGPDRDAIEAAYGAALHCIFAERHRRVDGFAARHFSLGGALRLHRRALGWDLLRAPANLALALPTVLLRGGAAVLRRCGAAAWARRLDSTSLFLRTDVGSELERLLLVELIELPLARDALAAALLSEPAIARSVEALLSGADPSGRARMAATLATYLGARNAAAEVATALASMAAGAVALHQLTPGMISLGPGVAAAIAQQSAIASFPLGAGLGGLWYAAFPAAASPALVIGITGAIAVAAAMLAAFAGIVTDPLQRRLGLHQRRLHRLLTVLEAELAGGSEAGLRLKDHYVARLLDLLDTLVTAHRLTR